MPISTRPCGIMRRHRICAVTCVTSSLQSRQFSATAHNNLVLPLIALVSRLQGRCPGTTRGQGPIKKVLGSVPDTELIEAAQRGRSRSLSPCRRFAEREFHNSTVQCSRPLKMQLSVAAAELRHEILCAVIQE